MMERHSEENISCDISHRKFAPESSPLSMSRVSPAKSELRRKERQQEMASSSVRLRNVRNNISQRLTSIAIL